MMEALDGINSDEEAESLGQLLVDKGALVHSEGSRCVDVCECAQHVRETLFSVLLFVLYFLRMCVLQVCPSLFIRF